MIRADSSVVRRRLALRRNATAAPKATVPKPDDERGLVEHDATRGSANGVPPAPPSPEPMHAPMVRVAHMPFTSAPAPVLHAKQSEVLFPPHVLLQQTPSTQCPAAQSVSTVHASPMEAPNDPTNTVPDMLDAPVRVGALTRTSCEAARCATATAVPTWSPNACVAACSETPVPSELPLRVKTNAAPASLVVPVLPELPTT